MNDLVELLRHAENLGQKSLTWLHQQAADEITRLTAAPSHAGHGGAKVEIAKRLRETTQEMANFASVNMELWDRHSNACLSACAAIAFNAAEIEQEIESVVQSVNEWDDRTSPDDYPEHLLITSDELADILRNFSAALTQAPAPTLTANVEPLGKEFEAAIFDDVEALYEQGPTLTGEVETPAPATHLLGYQDRVAEAHHALFHDDPTDIEERRARFAEEVNETLQAFGMSREDMHELVDYTWDRPVGEPSKEIGAAFLTLTSLCVVAGYDLAACGEADLEKLQRPETIARIRAKRATRHGRGPLPGFDPNATTEEPRT